MYEGVSDEVDEDQQQDEEAAFSPRRSVRKQDNADLDLSPLAANQKAPQRIILSVPKEDEAVHVEDERAYGSEVDVGAVDSVLGQDDDLFNPPKATGSASKRKRKVLCSSGEWIHEHELAGRTIVHEILQIPVRRSDRKQGKRALTEDSWDHNPFRLVPPTNYGANEAPFQVIVAPQVLITMDFHAHMSVAEVIGLLGGRFDAELRKLHVLSIFPCKSIGTRKECEMDPISEMEAVQQFAALDLQPVGWYHSHPTFEPSPSCRDIETQTMYQTLFTCPNDNTEPFLGFIISPFLKSSKGRSVIECVHLAHCKAQDENFRMPCRIEYTIDDSGEFFEYPGDLVDLYEKLQLTYMRTANFAGLFHEGYFINKLTMRLAGCTYEPSAKALLQRFRIKLREHL